MHKAKGHEVGTKPMMTFLAILLYVTYITQEHERKLRREVAAIQRAEMSVREMGYRW